MSPRLLTFGHGTAGRPELSDLLSAAGVTRVVDVRRFPGSRKHPHVKREALESWLPDLGVDYRWEERLGGRRRPDAAGPDTWWRVEAFRGYAAHMRTTEFSAAVDDLLRAAADGTLAVMCSESLWWRCHRRMIADFCVRARGAAVNHLGHDGKLTDHPVADGARLEDGLLVYDGARDPVRSRSQASSTERNTD